MKNKKRKNVKSLEAVTHTHTHTHTHLNFLKKGIIKKTQYNCVYLGYKDGQRKVVCLFCMQNTS